MTRSRRSIAWAVALLALAVALVFFNLPDASGAATAAPDEAAVDAYESDAPAGFEVGERLPDFTLAQTDGGTFTLSENRGKVVVINLWATWCTPCVNELPHFDRLQREYPDDVTVLAIHSDLITDDPLAYLSRYDYGVAFAVDEEGAVIAGVGGSTMLPQTVVLDRRGVVTYNRVGSVTYEALEALAREAMEAE